MNLIEEGMGGERYLNEVTRLLIRVRADDPGGGPWDAADLQWWSRSGHYEDPERLRFWSAPGTPSAVCVLFPTVGNTVAFTCLWTRAARDVALAQVIPEVISRVQALARAGSLVVDIEALETDTEWRQLLERRGFQRVTGGSIQAELYIPDATLRPWASPSLTIVDATHHTRHDPHPLEQRSGAEIRRRLLGCSLYRPGLDLAMKAPGGEVVAYCICWADLANRFAMLEPMRTEAAWQRRGLGTALIAEQARRLLRLGVESLRVNYAAGNPAAERLYAQSRFVVRFGRVLYRWVAPDASPSR